MSDQDIFVVFKCVWLAGCASEGFGKQLAQNQVWFLDAPLMIASLPVRGTWSWAIRANLTPTLTTNPPMRTPTNKRCLRELPQAKSRRWEFQNCLV